MATPFTLRQAARMLGGEIVGRQIIAPGPCHSRSDRSLSIKFDRSAPDGFRVHSFAGDDFRECRDHVRERLGIDRGPDDAPSILIEPIHMPVAKSDVEGTRDALAIWGKGRDARSTRAEEYLRGRRLELPPEADGEALRWHAGEGAMLALFRNVMTDEPQAISRTYIGSDGGKRGRLFKGPVAGAAIMLTPSADVAAGLTIAEGIETAIACGMIGLRPAWATGSAVAIGSFPVLAGVESLTIARETDKTGANHRESDKCTARWQTAGREVLLFDPVVGDAADAIGAIA